MIDWDADAAHFGTHWARLAGPARQALAGALDLRGARLLDVGCGNGDFCALALARGADVSGIDASEAMIASARERAPEADLRDPLASLREWMRVTRPGGAIAICAWAERERCEVDVVEAALRELGGAQAGEPFGPRLETVAREAGLAVRASDEVAVPYEVTDQEELEVAFLLDARGYGAIETAGERGSRAAITAAAAPFRRDDGSYRFENVFRYVIGSG